MNATQRLLASLGMLAPLGLTACVIAPGPLNSPETVTVTAAPEASSDTSTANQPPNTAVDCPESGRRIDADVTITGGHCSFSHTEIYGKLMVAGDGSVSTSQVGIFGDVEAVGAAAVVVNRSTITGDLVAEGSRTIEVHETTIERDVRIEGTSDEVLLTRATIRGDLHCADNAVRPTGRQLTVQGRQTGQCAGL